MKGRSIADNLIMYREAKCHAFASGEDYTFLQLDFPKAFDSVELHFMDAGLKAMGFGCKFRHWIKIICKDASSKVIVNGRLTRRIRLRRSVRQGCPIAPFIFIILTDIFVQMINAEDSIEGLRLPGGSLLRSMIFVDDSHLVSRTIASSLDGCAGIIFLYGDVSGILVAWEKTFAVCTLPHPEGLPGLLVYVKILLPGKSKKYLGMLHGPEVDDSCIGEQLVEKLKKKCAQLQSPVSFPFAGS